VSGRSPDGSGSRAAHEAASASSPEASIPNAVRPWQPWERNFSGGRIGVQEQQGADENWMILNVESGIAKTTTSLRYHEAWDLALMLSPHVRERLDYLFGAMKKAQNALHQFTWADTIAPTLRKIADDWDCCPGCDREGSSTCHERDEGCRFVEAHEMRECAAALEFAATLRAASATEGDA
jgi:hypothetical protein